MKALLYIIPGFFIVTLGISAQTHKNITLEKIFVEGAFNTKTTVKLRSMKDGEHYTVLEVNNAIVKYSYISGEAVDTLFSPGSGNVSSPLYISDYAFDSNESRLLLATSKQIIYRNSFSAEYYIYNMADKSIMPLSSEGRQRLATFSPDGSKVCYVRDNNLYYRDLLSDKTISVTQDGRKNEIINGAPDWVYEEEFAFTKAFAWSPDSRKIAFFRFDESNVRQFNIVLYDSLYPELYKYKYPKAGEANSVVSIYVYDVNTGITKKMDAGTNNDQYIPGIKWTADLSVLCITRLNRLQNKLDILLADAATGKSKIIYTEENKYYISEITDSHITFTDNNKHFILMSEADGYMHLYLYDIKGNLVNRITKGMWCVDEFLGVDQGKGVMYYRSTEESPLQRHVYSIKPDGSGKKMITKKPGINKVNFSRGYKYFVNYHSAANTPDNIAVYNSSGRLIRVLEDNKLLSERTKAFGFVKKEFIRIPLQDGTELNAWILKPADFNISKRYPVFMYVYGGPGSQLVLDEWQAETAWHQMLVQKGYIVVCVDNRGTPGRGEQFAKCTYMQLGKLETEDLINSARYLAGLPYIDKTRIGIFGKSYGGYLTLMCLTKGANIFKTGISYAPVTDWRFYDTIYTERYMRTPRENKNGYEESSVLIAADKIKGKLLIIHGTADDNVHLQHSMIFIEKLIRNNIQFDMQLYPDKSHSISGGVTKYHLYKHITGYISTNL